MRAPKGRSAAGPPAARLPATSTVAFGNRILKLVEETAASPGDFRARFVNLFLREWFRMPEVRGRVRAVHSRLARKAGLGLDVEGQCGKLHLSPGAPGEENDSDCSICHNAAEYFVAGPRSKPGRTGFRSLCFRCVAVQDLARRPKLPRSTIATRLVTNLWVLANHLSGDHPNARYGRIAPTKEKLPLTHVRDTTEAFPEFFIDYGPFRARKGRERQSNAAKVRPKLKEDGYVCVAHRATGGWPHSQRTSKKNRVVARSNLCLGCHRAYKREAQATIYLCPYCKDGNVVVVEDPVCARCLQAFAEAARLRSRVPLEAVRARESP